MKRVAFIISHPIQYYVPILQGLGKSDLIELKVFYTWGEDSIKKFDPGFNKFVEWDLPLLEGYLSEFLLNTADDKGTHHFNGIKNPTIISKIEEFNPDKIVILGWSFHSHLKVLKYFKGKTPIYFRGDSHLLNETNALKSFIRSIYLRRVYKYIDFAIAVGTNNKAYFRKFGLKDSQILFAGHAVDESKFSENDSHIKLGTSQLKEELGINNANITFIYCGKFEKIKRLDLLMGAFLNMKNKDTNLVLIGNGEEEGRLKSMANGKVKFLDFQNQSIMPSVYRIGDVFVLPSESETWGLGINEAMNCGLAIIASNKVGSAIDLIDEGGNGFIFNSGNQLSLQEKMDLIANDKSKLAVFKNHSITKITNWSMQNLINKLETILSN